MNNLPLLALEGVDPGHVAANFAVPIAGLIFGGAMFALLWSNFGAKKGALILGTALFGFMGFIGVFWWFGAPGTPVAAGPQNLPGQAADEYQPAWFPFEPASPRAEFFPITNNVDDFQTLGDFVGTTDELDPMYNSIRGDLDAATQLMVGQYFPVNADGFPQIGANRRAEIQANTPEPPDGYAYGEPAYTARLVVEGDANQAFLGTSEGQRVAYAQLEVVANYAPVPNEDGTTPDGFAAFTETVETGEWFAFKDPGAIWLPSAVWTIASFLLFGLCLVVLDRIEMREKRENEAVEEPLDLEVPVAQ
jgi:hypothetical protein